VVIIVYEKCSLIISLINIQGNNEYIKKSLSKLINLMGIGDWGLGTSIKT